MGKALTFIVTTERGRGDTTDWEFEYEVSDDDYERLVESSKKYQYFTSNYRIGDIYREVLEAAISQATSDMLEDEYDDIAEMLEEEGRDIEDEDWSADEWYGFSVELPNELREMYAPEAPSTPHQIAIKYCVTFGKGDGGDMVDTTFSLTEEEYEELVDTIHEKAECGEYVEYDDLPESARERNEEEIEDMEAENYNALYDDAESFEWASMSYELKYGLTVCDECGELFFDADNEPDETHLCDNCEDDVADNWEEYDGYSLAVETINWTTISFTDNFRREVFEKYLKKNEMSAEEFFKDKEFEVTEEGIVESEDEIIVALNISFDGENVIYNNVEFGNDWNSGDIIEIVKDLGYEPKFKGERNRFGEFGVWVIE